MNKNTICSNKRLNLQHSDNVPSALPSELRQLSVETQKLCNETAHQLQNIGRLRCPARIVRNSWTENTARKMAKATGHLDCGLHLRQKNFFAIKSFIRSNSSCTLNPLPINLRGSSSTLPGSFRNAGIPVIIVVLLHSACVIAITLKEEASSANWQGLVCGLCPVCLLPLFL